MKRRFRLPITIFAVSIFTLVTTAGWSQNTTSDIEPPLPAGVQRQDQAASQAADIAYMARQTGLSEQQVEQAVTFQETFIEYAKGLHASYSGLISRIWMDPVPGRRGYIQFKGDVPTGIIQMENVQLTGGGLISRAEHVRRAELASEALRTARYRNFLTYFDATKGTINVEIVTRKRSAKHNFNKIFNRVKKQIQRDGDMQGAALQLLPADLNLKVIKRSGEIYTLEHSRGGNWLQDDGFRECTSGWSVSGPDGNGIITAAHCTGLNLFEESGGTTYSMTWQDQERGDGDAEYHTTSHSELAEFWASSTEIRDVEDTKETIWMLPGSSVCVYGRSSNIRGCSHSIEATGVQVTFTDGVTVDDLVRASGDTTIGGDSGGGWSWSTKAWGVHSGSNGVDSYFTPIQKAESELNVDVLIAP